jgi:hypothetical protein
MESFWLIDSSFSRHMTEDRRWFSSLTPVVSKEYITFGDNGKVRVLSVGTVKVSERVTLRHVVLVKSLGFNFLSVSQLHDEGFEVYFRLHPVMVHILGARATRWRCAKARADGVPPSAWNTHSMAPRHTTTLGDRCWISDRKSLSTSRGNSEQWSLRPHSSCSTETTT